MSSLSRVNYVAQQRLDLQHLLAAESYTAFDFRALITAFTGSKPFILAGFEVIGKTGLAITINVQDSLTFNPLDGNGSFYKGLSDDDQIIIELPAQQENLFIEGHFVNVTESPINTAQWDPLALTGEDVAGTEFSASINSQVLMKLVISANSVGFTEGAMPILRASTDGSNVTKMIDCRPMLYRLGSGGVSPNPANKFSWGSKRRESVPSGVGIGDEVNSPFMAKDLSGALNDKALGTFKEWADAMMTRICEISGSSLWYASDVAPNEPTHGYITGIDLQRLALDSEGGHSIQPSESVSIKWVRNDPTQPINESTNPLLLTAEGPDGIDDISVIHWQVNYGPVTWELGGEFINNTPGGNRRYKTRPYTSPNRVFESPYIVNNGNLYLLLERDVTPPLSSGNAVKWASNASYPAAPDPTKVVSGVTGDFTGIAIGDWVRKASEGFSQYYKVTQFSNGLNTVGDIADSSVVAIVVERSIATGASVEEVIYFRSRYAASDMFGDDTSGEYNARDSNYYWLGRRVNTTLIFRGYGNLSEGEEAFVKDDASMENSSSEPFILKHANDAVYSVLNGYSIRAGATTELIKIKKRKRNNLVFTGSGTDNTDGFLEYYINAPVGLMTLNDGLWVRLNDTAGGVLTNGTVVIDNDDYQNLDITSNKWQILPMSGNPLRNFDNQDVHLIARRIVLADGITPAVQFVDGTIIDAYGLVVDHYEQFNKDIRVKADVYLGTKTPKSVLFIDEVPTPLDGDPTAANGRIDEDNVSFNYSKIDQELKMFNNVFGVNYMNVVSPIDQQWWVGLSNHTLSLGDSNSSINIPGNLTVQGSQTIIGTSNTITADKIITLGVGNGLYGGGGSGMQVADNTLKILTAQTYIGLTYIDITPETDPGYVTDQLFGMVSAVDLDNITAGEMNNVYKMKLVGATAGDSQYMGLGVYRIWTKGTATASVVHTYTTLTSPIQSFDLLSEIHLSNSNTSEAGMTSWSFGVKRNPNLVNAGNEGTVHAVLTPYESSISAQDFLTIPKARQGNFTRRRIPYAWEDGVGAGGSDTTFDFTERLYWDYNTFTFRIWGTLQLKGNFIPEDDNTYDLGSTAYRWKTVHVGPGSFVCHNDNTDTNWVNMSFTGGLGQITTDSGTNLLLRSASLNQFKLFADKRGSFGLADSSGGNVNAIFEFGNNAAANVLSGINQYGVVFNSRLGSASSGTTNYLLDITGVISGGANQFVKSVYIHSPSLIAGAIVEHVGIEFDDLSVGTDKIGIRSHMSKNSSKWFIAGGSASSYHLGSLGLGNTTRATIDAYRLVIGTTSDTTTAGGILIGGDVEIYRSAANFLRIGDNLVVDLTSKLTQQTLIGTGSHSTNAFLTLNGTIPDASSALVGVDANMVGGLTHSGSGSSITGFLGRPSTANFGSSTVVTDMTDFYASQPVNGILSSVTNMTGFYVGDFLVSAATNKYGFKSLMTQGTNKWDLYLAGGASSYISGSVGIGNALQSTIESFRLLVGTPLDSTSNKGMSFGGDTTLYRYGVNSLKTDGDFNIGQAVYIGQFANFVSYGSSLFPPNPSGNNITIFTQQGITWQRESDGNTIALTNEQGNVYEEEVDVLGSTSTPTILSDSTGLSADTNVSMNLTQRYAGSFLNVNASTLTSIDLSFQRFGVTGGLAKVEIWSYDGATNKPLAYIGESTNSQNIGVIPTTFTPQLFNFVFSGISLSAGTKYFMVAKVVGGSNPGNVGITINGPGNGYYRGNSSDSGVTWQTPYMTQFPLFRATGDVMVGPSGNNQMSPIVANPLGTILTLPKDKIYLLGNNLVARTVSAGSGEVRISKKNHTMSNGDIVTVAATNALDGITAGQMTGSFLVTVVDTDTISIATAGSATVGGVYGYVNRVSTIKIRYYLVGQKELELYLNGVLQRRGEHWDELGTSNTQSNTVKIYREFNIKDRVTWRIDSNGGQTMIGAGGGGGSGSLQSAYNSGSTISISPAAPVEISGSGTLMNIYGILNAYTTISKGHEFSTQVASPVASGKYGLWVDTAGVLYYHKDTVDIAIFSSSSENLTSSGLENGALTTMVFQTPVSYGSLGTLQRVDVSSEALSTATFGVVSSASIGVGSTGSVCTSGKMENVVGSFTFGDVIYVDKTGSLSNTKPSIGVGGFVSGDSIVRIGVILRNKTNPLLKDLIIGVQYVGKL